MSMLADGKRLVVLGGGLAGLSFLHYLRTFSAFYNKTSLFSKIILLEANDYMGGSIKSVVHEDGVVHELGPRSVRTAGARGQNTGVLFDQLGLSEKILTITSKSSAGKNRYIYNNDQLYKVALNITGLFSKLPAAKSRLINSIVNDLKNSKLDLTQYPARDPPLYDFIANRFGNDAAEYILDPLIRGVAAGDARKLSGRAFLEDFIDREQAHGSILKSMFKPPVTKYKHDELYPNDIIESKLLDKFQKTGALSYNLQNGLQTLPEHLSNSLLNTNDDGLISIYNRTQAVAINFNENKEDGLACSVKVKTVDGDFLDIEADHIVSAIPSVHLTKILPDSMPAHQRKALEHITNIPHAPVGCVGVEYRDYGPLPKVTDSFGFLTHSKAGSKVLGISFDSAMFPAIDKPVGSFRMTCMMGGAWFEQVFGTANVDQVTDSQMEQIALSEIRRILGIQDEPHRVSTILWKTGIAQYSPGHSERLEKTRKNIAELKIPLTLLGQSYDGIAINDVIYSARSAAAEFVKSAQ